jgi:hypothetical protein
MQVGAWHVARGGCLSGIAYTSPRVPPYPHLYEAVPPSRVPPIPALAGSAPRHVSGSPSYLIPPTQSGASRHCCCTLQLPFHMQNHARRCTHCMLYTVMQSMRNLHCIVNVLSGISSVSGRLLYCTVCCATCPLVSCCTVQYLASAPAPYFQIQPLFLIYYCILTPALPPYYPLYGNPSFHPFLPSTFPSASNPSFLISLPETPPCSHATTPARPAPQSPRSQPSPPSYHRAVRSLRKSRNRWNGERGK